MIILDEHHARFLALLSVLALGAASFLALVVLKSYPRFNQRLPILLSLGAASAAAIMLANMFSRLIGA